MKVDRIIKNAKIFTSDQNNLLASALAVKDGKFVYAGDEAGLSDFEGEVTDLGGKFIMPGIIDSHVHVTTGVGFDYANLGDYIECDSKQSALDFMSEYIKKNPGMERYNFILERRLLNGEPLTKDDLDAICPDNEVLVLEGECHSCWVNSKILDKHGITDDTPDPVPGLSFYERKDGHITGNVMEISAEVPLLLDNAINLTDEQVDAALDRWIEFCLKHGVAGVFDAGNPGFHTFNEKIYKRLRDLDLQGKLPIYIDGCYVVAAQWEAEEGLKELLRYRREYDTEHLKVHTMKIFMDGTQTIHTAAMVTPYEDTNTVGNTAFSKEELAELIIKLNAEDLDLHLHTVGERASREVLDAVEMARKELGDDYHVKVTCAHLEIQDDADLNRFAELGVIANYTPWWHCGGEGDPLAPWIPILGEKRATHMFRCKTLWDSGALVTWSSDNIAYEDFATWNPYLGMEIGMTRQVTDKTKLAEFYIGDRSFPPAEEKMSIEEMILGYTINGAKQLGIETSKGSIEVGKDADFLVFDKDLLAAEQEGFSYNLPSDVYLCGKKI